MGVGFLGAGVIIQERGNVRGMTTAASIWCAAAIGMASGLSLYVVAVGVAVMMVVLLEARPLTRRIDEYLRRAGASVEDDSNLPETGLGSEGIYGTEDDAKS